MVAAVVLKHVKRHIIFPFVLIVLGRVNTVSFYSVEILQESAVKAIRVVTSQLPPTSSGEVVNVHCMLTR